MLGKRHSKMEDTDPCLDQIIFPTGVPNVDAPLAAVAVGHMPGIVGGA